MGQNQGSPLLLLGSFVVLPPSFPPQSLRLGTNVPPRHAETQLFLPWWLPQHYPHCSSHLSHSPFPYIPSLHCVAQTRGTGHLTTPCTPLISEYHPHWPIFALQSPQCMTHHLQHPHLLSSHPHPTLQLSAHQNLSPHPAPPPGHQSCLLTISSSSPWKTSPPTALLIVISLAAHVGLGPPLLGRGHMR